MVKNHRERSTSCWTSVTSVILGFFRSGPQRKPVVANSFGAANAQEAAQLGGLHYSLHRRRFVNASPCGSGPVPELASLEASGTRVGEGKQSSRAVPVLCPGQGQLLMAPGTADPLWLPLAAASNSSASGRRCLVGKGLTWALVEKGLAAFAACQTLFSRG